MPLCFESSEGYLIFKSQKKIRPALRPGLCQGGISIFQDGIFVTQTDGLLPEGARQNIIGRINLTGEERCELSMDRNRIFWTDSQVLSIKGIIRNGIVDLANRVLDSDPSTDANSGLVNHLAAFFDFNEINHGIYFRLNPRLQKIVAKRFRDFIRINFSHTRENRHVPEADG